MCCEVEDKVVVFFAWDLEIDGEDEATRMGAFECVDYTVIGTREDVIEFVCGGFEPVYGGEREEIIAAGRFLFCGEVVMGAEREDVAWW